MADDVRDRLRELVAGLEKTVPYAAALHKKSSGTRVNVNRVQETVEPASPVEGVVFTLWNGQRFYEHAANGRDWAGLKSDLADLARRAASEVDRLRPVTDIDPGPPAELDVAYPESGRPEDAALGEKLALARQRLAQAVSADKQAVSNAFSVYQDAAHEDVFVNRAKTLRQKISRVDAYMMVFVTDGAKSVELFRGTSKNGGLQSAALSEHDIREMVMDAKRLLDAGRLAPGVYDVVVDPEWAGIIAHECFGHGMETDLYVRDRALSRNYIGKPIASPIVNMFDDPSLIQEAGGFRFDDEGQIAAPTHIIKDGVLQRGLTDLASAHALGLPRSANGRRESFARKAYARMTNTFFDSGANAKEEILESVEDGLYLRYATNGMEDPQAWGIQVEGLWAEEIKNGRRTGKVYSPVIMTGFVPDLLKSISMVGNDRHISGLGMCGKGHKEWVKNTTGGPHMRLRARLA